MRQTKESNKRAPGRVVPHISHLVSIYTLTFSNVVLVLALNLTVHKSSYCKCSLAWCQARTFLLFTVWTHPLQMREYPLQYASTDKNKKSHYNLYLGLVEVGERTYINGPPNPPLNLPAHLCSITYRTMYCKTRKMEKLSIRSRRTFMMGWLQLRRWKSKNNYPKGDSITEQNVAGWWTIDLS